MAVAVDDVVRVALQWFLDGLEEVVNVHTFVVEDMTGVTSDGDFMVDLAALLESSLYDNVVGDFCNNLLGQVITGLNLTKGEVLPPALQTIDGANSAADALPHQVTALVCLNGVQPRRQGRSYLPPFADNNIDDDGTWGATTIAHLLTYGADMLANIDAGALGVQRVISNESGTSFFFPTSATIVTSPRTQRRRTLGRGS